MSPSFSSDLFATSGYTASTGFNLPLAIGSAVFCQGFWMAVNQRSGSVWLHHSIDYRDQWEWSTRFVSTVHSAAMGMFAIYAWLPLLFTALTAASEGASSSVGLPLVGVLPWAGVASSLSIGYFVWDTLLFTVTDHQVLQRHRLRVQSMTDEMKAKARAPKRTGDFTMWLHHIVAGAGQYVSIHWAGMAITYAFLLACEITTPFLNIMWLRRKANQGSDVFQKFLEISFIALWLVFRLAIPGYLAFYFVQHLATIHQHVPWQPVAFCYLAIPFINFVNWMWFYKILSIFFGGDQDEKKEKDSKKRDDSKPSSSAQELPSFKPASSASPSSSSPSSSSSASSASSAGGSAALAKSR